MEQTRKRLSRLSGIKIFWIVMGSILGLLFIWLILTVNSELKMEGKLIAMRDHILETEEVNMDITSKGEYAKIEKVMKEYYQEYLTYYDQVNENNYIAIYNMLTPEFLAYKKEDLEKLLKGLNSYQETFNQGIDGMITLLDEDLIEHKFIDANIDYYYLDFYKELMILESDQDTLATWREYKKENDEKMPYIKSMIEILAYNLEEWYIEDETLYINDNTLLEEYNTYYHLTFDDVSRDELIESNFM